MQEVEEEFLQEKLPELLEVSMVIKSFVVTLSSLIAF